MPKPLNAEDIDGLLKLADQYGMLEYDVGLRWVEEGGVFTVSLVDKDNPDLDGNRDVIKVTASGYPLLKVSYRDGGADVLISPVPRAVFALAYACEDD